MGIFSGSGQDAANKVFSRSTHQEWKPYSLQILKAGQQRVVLLEIFSEAEAGIDGDLFAPHTCQHSRLRPVAKLALDLQNNIAGRRKGSPFFWASAHVH